MSPHVPAATNEAVQKAREKATLLADAFESVFGQAKSRRPDQKLVFEHLNAIAATDKPQFNFSDKFDGITTALAAAQIDGAQNVLKCIGRQLLIASKSQSPRKPPPKTLR